MDMDDYHLSCLWRKLLFLWFQLKEGFTLQAHKLLAPFGELLPKYQPWPWSFSSCRAEPLVQPKEVSFHAALTPFTGFYLFQSQTQLSISCLARKEAASGFWLIWWCSWQETGCWGPSILVQAQCPGSIHRDCRQGEGSVWQLGVAHVCQCMSVLCELQSDPWGNSAIPIDDAFWNEMLSSYRPNRELPSLSAFWLWDYHVWILNTWSKTCRPFVLAQGRIFRQFNNGNLPACSLHHLWKSCYRTDLRRGW